MKVAIYCRVSTLEQSEKGYSVEEQERKLKAYCDINDWSIYNIYVDAGYSGAKTDRPALSKLIDDIEKIDLVLVYKLDSLTRSVRDLLEMLEVFENNDVAFRSATEVYDTTSAMGRLFVTLVGAMAEWERTTIQERTYMGRRAAAKKGLAKTTPPFYYDRVGDKFVPNKYSEVLRYAVDEVKKGTSVSEITRRLNNSKYKAPNGNMWYRSVVTNALKSPVARGHYVFDDILVENTHEPIITDSEFKQIEARISERTRSIVQTHHSVFKGKLECPICSQKLTLNTVKHSPANKDEWYSKHYYCDKCKSLKNEYMNISEDEVLKKFHYYLENLDLKQYEVENLKEENSIQIDIDKVMEERKRYHMLFAKGMMKEDELFQLIKDTDDVIKEYEKQKEDKDIKNFDIDKIKNFKYSLLDGWEMMSNEMKSEFISIAIQKIEIEYIKGSRGKIPNSININKVVYY